MFNDFTAGREIFGGPSPVGRAPQSEGPGLLAAETSSLHAAPANPRALPHLTAINSIVGILSLRLLDAGRHRSLLSLACRLHFCRCGRHEGEDRKPYHRY